MNIEKKLDGNRLELVVSGRLDTSTAPQLEVFLRENLNDTEYLVFDFESLEYLSSAGLRVILSAQKVMNKQGEMVVRNVNDTIMEIFEITGFSEILTIER